MKKTLISLAIVFVLIAGYFVGNSVYDHKGDQPSLSYGGGGGLGAKSADGFDDSLSSTNSESNIDSADGSQSSKSADDYNYEIDDPIKEPGCAAIDCVEPMPMPTPIGPKGGKIVKSGEVQITIKKGSLENKYEKVVKLIPEGGYIEASTTEDNSSTLTVRIPSEKLDSTLVDLRKLGTVKKEAIDSVDRTFESIDYDSRLKIMQERQTVLEEQLRNSNANNSSYIQEQLFNLRTQIETLQGQKDFLDSTVALSTLTVELTEKGAHKKDPGEQTMIGKAWTKSVNAMLTSFGGILIVTTALLPFLVIAFIIIALIKRALKGRKKELATDE